MTVLESIVDGIVDIRAHKGRTALQTIGVVLGVASVVTVLALVDSGRRKSLEFFSEIGGLRKLLVVNAPVRDVSKSALQLSSVGLTYDDALALRTVEHVAWVDPVVITRVLATRPDYQKEWNVDGVTPDYAMVYKFHPARGRFLIQDDLKGAGRVCVLGDTAARQIFGSEDPLGRTLYMDGTGFTVVGILQRKEYFFDRGRSNALEWMNRKIFVPLTTAHRRFLGDEQRRVNFINAVVEKAAFAPKASADIRALLLRRHRGVADFEVWDRAERLQEQEQRTRMLDIVFLAAGAVSLVVGGIVIMNILLASFQERVREVGVRKALGANGLHIAAQFLVESVLVTLLGGAAGVLLGFAFTAQVSILIDQPAVITPDMALVGFVTAVVVGVFFGFYPAVKAARLNPVDALRYE